MPDASADSEQLTLDYRPESDTDRLIRILREHPEGMSHRALYPMGIMVHSRAADARRKGFDLRVKRVGEEYVWRLVEQEKPEKMIL